MDHLATNESEQAKTTSTLSRPLHECAAWHISNILSPVVVSLPLVVLVALYHAHDVVLALVYACITLFFLSIGPMIYILVGVRLGKLTDADVSLRTQRIGPFLFGLISALMGLFTLLFFHGPKNLETLLLITIVNGIVMMLTTLWWKISIHASSLAAAVTMLTALYGLVVLLAFLLVVLVCWSRVVLQRHTLAQVIAGSLVSIALSVLVLMLRGV